MIYSEFPDSVELRIATWLDSTFKAMGITAVEIDRSKLRQVCQQISEYDGFPHGAGFESSSPFKKAAYFFCLFVNARPITKLQPISAIHEGIWNNETSASEIVSINVYFAYLMVKESLLGVGFLDCNGRDVLLEKPIIVSVHTMQDMIEAYAPINVDGRFMTTCLLFEQMCYKVNPTAPYPEIL